MIITWPLTLAGTMLVAAAWLHYLALIPIERVPKYPVSHVSLMTIGLVIGFYQVVLLWQTNTPGWWLIGVFLLVSIILAGLFFFLLIISNLPPAPVEKLLGHRLPEISLLDQDGNLFSLNQPTGQRLLIKVYRGFW